MDDVRQPEPDAAHASPPADTPPKGRGRAFLIVGLVLAVAVVGGVLYWLDARHYESTDDAAIDGHISQIAAEVAGRVIDLRVTDNQVVAAGQILLEIDPRDYQMRLDQARAQQAEAAAQLEQAQATLAVREADVLQAAAQIRVAESDVRQAAQDLARYRAVNPRAITRQTLDTAGTTASGATARLDANRATFGGMQAQLKAAHAQVDAAAATLRNQDAAVANAELQLSRATLRAPAAGRVARRTVELGNYVNAGQALLAIVQPTLWVTANFKETQLTAMHDGQTVRVRVDAFPGHPLAAHIDSIQAGTGAVFSSLPAENATGNYVKVVQRVPVKIVFDGTDWQQVPLAPGMSVIPRVTVR